MKPFALTLGMAGLAVWVCGSYALACGFMVLGIIFALEWLTTPTDPESREGAKGAKEANTQTPKHPNTQGEKL